MSAWPKVNLSEVLSLRDSSVPTADLHEINLAGVYSFARGLFKRGPMSPSDMTYSYFNRLVTDDFVISVPKAWEGAIARVPPEFEGWFLSPVFPTFRAHQDKLFPGFLEWYCRREPVWSELQSKSRGIGARRESVHPTQFLSLEIPLPPLAEQRRVVKQIEALAAQIHEARTLRQEATEETQGLLGAHSLTRFGTLSPKVPLGDVCAVIDPNPSHRYPLYVQDGVPIVSSSEFVGDDEINPASAKHVPREFYEATLGRYSVGEGDVVFSRKGKVGYARPHPGGMQLAMTHTLCVLKPDRFRVDPRYLLHFARSPVFLEGLTGIMNPNVGVPTLGLKVIRDAPFPVPTLTEQRRIVAELDAVQVEVDALKRLQTDTAAELVALLPSILDRAFNGAL